MPRLGWKHHLLSRLVAAAGAACVILSALSKVVNQDLGASRANYLLLATVLLLFAIFFMVDGWADTAKKAQ
ncbi:MAG: hypothetical protein ACXABY_24970 [Candidatus Thorarchaeota archaeon]|jgi:hypothetical protein